MALDMGARRLHVCGRVASILADMSDNEARAFWITGPRRGEIRAEQLRSPGPGELLIRTLYTGVSRGTEALVYANRVPVTEHARMRAPFQSGDFPSPVKYGYANVGRVEEGPRDLRGRNVFCLFPHQTRYVVPAAAVHVLPDDVPPARAVLAANLETAVNGLWDAAPHIGDRVAIVGAGTVGCLAAWLASRIPAAAVELIDINPAKAPVARARRGVSRTQRGRGLGRCRRAHERLGRGPRDGARARRIRGPSRRAQLVWGRSRRRCARRGFPQPAPAACLVTGRHDRARAT
jgi:hypothetical protein